jgi:hypothetical protein
MQQDDKLSNLDKYISEIRDILNEVSITTEDKEARLIISQCLDELIVEYMKLTTQKNT